jgi:hypothetical protein
MNIKSVNTRRSFLIDCSVTMAALTLVPAGSASVTGFLDAGHRSLGQITYAALASQVNTVFRVRLSSARTVALELLKAPVALPTHVRPGRRAFGDAGNEKFSLVFSGPEDEWIESGTHHFEHSHLGGFEMFISPVGRRDIERVRYEAVFNRPPNGASIRENLR